MDSANETFIFLELVSGKNYLPVERSPFIVMNEDLFVVFIIGLLE